MPAAAIAWQFTRRHRRGAGVLGAYFLALAATKAFSVGAADTQSFAFLVVVPMTSAFLWLLSVFTFGLDGDLAARASIYPPRMFALPVTNAALAGWPMLCGSTVMLLLWFAARTVAIWPPAMRVPIVWPGLMGAVLLAWTQALTWMPYAVRGLRVIVTVIWLVTIDTVVFVALQSREPEAVMVLILAPQLPVAYLAARMAVARARRGEVPEWRFAAVDIGRRQRRRFSSPAEAQAWFDSRRYGRSLPLLVGLLLPFELAMLFLFSGTPSLVFATLAFVMLTPPVTAIFATVSFGNAGANDPYGIAPFIATRPLSNASLAAAKLRATIVSTLAAWLLVAVTVPIALRLSGTLPLLMERARSAAGFIGTERVVAIALVVLVALIAATWKQLVFGLTIVLTGREWLVKGIALLALGALIALGPLAHWLTHSRGAFTLLWSAVPWIAAALVLVKIAAAGWIAARLHDRNFVSDRMLLAGALCWDAAVFALYGLLVWIFPELLVRHYLLGLLAILQVPLVRLSAAPLALAWNRHR